MSITVKGVQDVIEQPRRRRYFEGRCVATIRTWRGKKAAIDAFALANQAVFVEGFEIVDNGRSAMLVAEFADSQSGNIGGDSNGVLREVWERDRILIDKPIETHPRWADAGTGETDATKRATALAAAKLYLEHRDWDRLIADIDDSNAVPNWVQEYIKDRDLGTEYYKSEYYVIRHRRVLASKAKVRAADANAFTWSNEAPGVPSSVKFTVPGGKVWLRMPTQVLELPMGKAEVIEEWWGLDSINDHYYTQAGD